MDTSDNTNHCIPLAGFWQNELPFQLES